MPANVQSMAYVGKAPWHEMGTPVTRIVHADEMMRAAGLDWTIEKRPARGAKPIGKLVKGKERYGRYEIVRLPRANTVEQEVVLGIVTDRYEPLQNQDAFGFFDPIVDQEKAFFETAGALGEGERVWVMAKMPDVMEIVRGDECQKYLLLSNTHTGQGSVVVKFTAIRVVCQNTLMLAMEDGMPAFRVRHSKVMSDRLVEVASLIAAATEVYEQAHELFVQMAKKRLSEDLLKRYLEVVFPNPKKGNPPPKQAHVRKLLDEADDLQMNGVRGTLWAAFNAVTRFEDYREVHGEVSESRLNRVWFGSGADLKLKAFQAARDLIAA